MLSKRVIPVVLMRNGLAVQSKGFGRYQVLGNPVTIVERLSEWASDELIYLDISRTPTYDLKRDDLGSMNRQDVLDIVEDVASRCFMPLTFGGRIRTIEDASQRVERGADKITINTGAIDTPSLIGMLATHFGSQCVVACIDVRRVHGAPIVFADGGRRSTERDAVAWARECADRGAGEILLQAIDRDGSGQGYDCELIHEVSHAVDIPVIALGGVGAWEHLLRGLDAGANAVAAANIFNFTEHAVHQAKEYLVQQGANVRPTTMALLAATDLPVEAA